MPAESASDVGSSLVRGAIVHRERERVSVAWYFETKATVQLETDLYIYKCLCVPANRREIST